MLPHSDRLEFHDVHISALARSSGSELPSLVYTPDMARKILHQLVDDLDGTVLEAGEGETVLFSLDGDAYEIDLTGDNAKALRDSLQPYLAAARRVSSRSGRNGARARRGGNDRDLAAIRAWARNSGYEVSERGRVAASIVSAYDAAH